MKKLFQLLASALILTGCADTAEIDGPNRGTDGAYKPINFQVARDNMTRSMALNEAKHYNFGVFAYKSTDKENNVMGNYLVGYHDDTNAYSAAGTTVGDTPGHEDGKSEWMYENLGYEQFTGTYAGMRLNPGDQYASNIDKQYLRYWDNAAPATYFYAYAPYLNTTATGHTVTYVDGTKQGTSDDTYVMTFPDGSIEHGYDNPAKYEYLYASAKVVSADYGHDVALQFRHLNAKVNIKFWENIQGYTVRIIDVNKDYSVSAVPAEKDGTSGSYGYKKGAVYAKSGVKIQFNEGAFVSATPTEGTKSDAPLNFVAPEAATIGENRVVATPSATTYYAIPKDDATGLTFHLSYELLSTSGEKITVKDATVFVPADYTNWQPNKHYTYIFKITKSSNGSTGDVTPDPTSPEVPTVQALYPIVFDNCTVEDWVESSSEHIITDATSAAYHDIILSQYSISSGTIDVTVTDNDTWSGHAINYSNIKVADPDGTNVTSTMYAAGEGKGVITVPAGAPSGTYTVTYTCEDGTVYNHKDKDTWTEKFEVGSAYTVSVKDVVATGGQADAYLAITTTKDGSAETTPSGALSIEYPSGVSTTDLKVEKVGEVWKVKIYKTAPEDFYKLIYKVGDKKVAEKVFEVRSFLHDLDQNIVYLNGTTQTVTSTHPAGADEELTLDAAVVTAGKITVDNTNFTISVASDTPAGSYNVYYTVDKSDSDSKVTYVRSFEVKETISVTVSKSSIDRNLGTSAAGDITDDAITVTTKKNGVVTTENLSADLSIVKSDKTATNEGDFTITYDSSTHKYVVRCKNTVPTGNYYVKFTQTLSGAPHSVYAIFTVQE